MDTVETPIKNLFEYLSHLPSVVSVQHHYKFEEWAAAEAFHYFRAVEKSAPWHPVAVVPYATAVAREKWCDLYVRRASGDGAADLHLWFEFKAIPLGAAAGTDTTRKFGGDLRALSNYRRDGTHRLWTNRRNPSGRTESAWLKKTDDLPGTLEQGATAGIAALFVGVRDERELHETFGQRLKPAVEKTSSVLVLENPNMTAPAPDGSRLGCLVYRVPMAG